MIVRILDLSQYLSQFKNLEFEFMWSHRILREGEGSSTMNPSSSSSKVFSSSTSFSSWVSCIILQVKIGDGILPKVQRCVKKENTTKLIHRISQIEDKILIKSEHIVKVLFKI